MSKIALQVAISKGYHASVHDLSSASSSSTAGAGAGAGAPAQQHPSTTPESHPLVLGGVPPLTAGGTQTSISLTAVSSPSGSSSAGGQRLDSTPHSVETPNQLLAAQQQDNVSDTGNNITSSHPSSTSLSCHFGEQQQQQSNGTANDYYIDNNMPKQQQQQQKQQHRNYGITVKPLSSSSSSLSPTANDRTATTTTKSPLLMMSLTKKRGIFPKPATNIMRAWLFHHLTFDLTSLYYLHTYKVVSGFIICCNLCSSLEMICKSYLTNQDGTDTVCDESLSMCGSLNDDGGRESVLSEGNTGSGGGSATGANKRKVPKVFSKEAITKFRAWLFQNLTVSFGTTE
uniref:Homeobox protein homothorax n=1 Tax=Setaria digitata TaxID=48799 RepID=A0A915Q3E5_9BILA